MLNFWTGTLLCIRVCYTIRGHKFRQKLAPQSSPQKPMNVYHLNKRLLSTSLCFTYRIIIIIAILMPVRIAPGSSKVLFQTYITHPVLLHAYTFVHHF